MRASRDDPPDDSLVQASIAGEDEAFAELVRRHKRKVFAIASRFARHDQELDDLCQEIFVRAYRSLPSFRGDAPFEHWLSRIAVRACYDALRGRKRTGVEIPLEAVALLPADGFPGDNPSGERAREVLEGAMSRLRPEERMVLTLLELEEKSIREVADLTGWSESNVKVRGYRARRALKKILERQGET